VLGYDVRKNLAPAGRFLVEELGLGRAGAVKVITTYPSVLGKSVEQNLAPKVRYLAEELGLERDGAVKSLPGTLACWATAWKIISRPR
jgi:mTERF domain-containing protein